MTPKYKLTVPETVDGLKEMVDVYDDLLETVSKKNYKKAEKYMQITHSAIQYLELFTNRGVSI